MPQTIVNDPETAIRDATQRIEPTLVDIRRDIHAHPELGFEEVRTSGVVARELERLGIPHRTGVGKTGVVGLIEGGRSGPVLAIRADMDALPIQEATGLPFASTNAGVMHACGHDIHTTTLLGVAAVLKDLAPRLAGTVKLVFQPAEEGLGGMQAMLDAGVLEQPHIDYALGFHNHPDMPVGTFGFVRGASLAAADRFEITVQGRSGHAAYPHTTVDPIVAAASLILQLQTVVSREVPPTRSAVVTVGAVQGGTTHNIIPDRVLIKGTVRTLHPDIRDLAEQAIRRLCGGIQEGMRVRCEVSIYRRGAPPLVNDDRVLEPTVNAVRQQFGDVVEQGEAGLGAEDFALMTALVPGFQLRIGSSQPGRADRLHNSAYQPDERCIGFGVQALARAALETGMRICVYGAGAIGGWLAGMLAESGAEVSVVARGAHLAAIRAHGLTLEMQARTVRVQVAASDHAAELGPQDAVVVTVKAPALPSVAAGIGPLLGPDTVVAFVTNGIPWWYFHAHGGTMEGRRLARLDPDDALWRAVGPARVLGGIAWPASSVPAPGVVRMVSGETLGVTFGEPDGSVTPRLQMLEGAFQAAGVPVVVSETIRDLIWQKLIFNLSAGPMCVLTQSPVRATQEEPVLVETSRRALAEAEAVARAMGRSPMVDVERIVATNAKLGHRPSILQDLEAGRPMEVDALYTVPLELARMVGVATPTLDLLVSLIKVRARAAGLYGG